MRSSRAPLFVLLLGLLGCAGEAPGNVAPPHAAPMPGGAAGVWDYDVTASPGARELTVDATLAAGSDAELSVTDGGERFVRNVEVADGATWKALAETRGSWRAPSCAAHGCRLRYRYALGEAAAALGPVSSARAHGGAIEAPPSTWLLRPTEPAAGTLLRFRVHSAPGDAFASGVFPGKIPDTYEAPALPTFQLAYSVFGRVRLYSIMNGTIQVAMTGALPSDGFDGGDDRIVAWVERSAHAVADYYRQFPVRHLLVIVTPGRRGGVGFGTTMGGGGASISIAVGKDVADDDLKNDWVLVHEMVHTALPDLIGRQHWLEEGLATYVEPLARARAGLVSAEELWGEWLASMQQGMPRDGDEGLDNTPTWGRTYWGGALFCLVADVEIRERTQNTKSLDDALRGILKAGGNIATAWDMAHVTAAGDAATGVPVLAELYAKMGGHPTPPDLAGLWKKLGVSRVGGRLVLDDHAPLGAIRKSMSP